MWIRYRALCSASATHNRARRRYIYERKIFRHKNIYSAGFFSRVVAYFTDFPCEKISRLRRKRNFPVEENAEYTVLSSTVTPSARVWGRDLTGATREDVVTSFERPFSSSYAISYVFLRWRFYMYGETSIRLDRCRSGQLWTYCGWLWIHIVSAPVVRDNLSRFPVDDPNCIKKVGALHASHTIAIFLEAFIETFTLRLIKWDGHYTNP